MIHPDTGSLASQISDASSNPANRDCYRFSREEIQLLLINYLRLRRQFRTWTTGLKFVITRRLKWRYRFEVKEEVLKEPNL
jgi:hypothetical protein